MRGTRETEAGKHVKDEAVRKHWVRWLRNIILFYKQWSVTEDF